MTRDVLPLFAGRKRTKTDLIVLHWTGGTGDHVRVRKTLKARGLSVHFVIDRDGTSWRMAKEETVCAHAKGVNTRSVGIEIVGKDGGFSQAQMIAVTDLCKELCGRFALPRQTPRERLGMALPAGFRGVCGHMHVSVTKLDPGPWVFDELERRGFLAV